MPSAFIKEVRFTITALFLLLLATIAVLARREELSIATAKVEQLALTQLLLEVPPAALTFEGSVAPSRKMETRDDQLEEGEWESDFKTAAINPNAGTGIEVMAEHGASCLQGCRYQTPLPTGGWLSFSVRPAPDQSKLGYPEFEKTGTPPAKHSPFVVQVTVQNPGTGDNAIVSAVPPILFSNINIAGVEELDEHQVPGRVYAYNVNQSNALSSIDLTATALQIARQFGITTKDTAGAYAELRGLYERQEVVLPVVGLSIKASLFVASAYGLSVALAAWASFLLRLLRWRLPDHDDEPSFIIEPVRQRAIAVGFDRAMAFCELTLFAAFHVAALIAPLVLAGLVLKTNALGSPVASAGAIIVGAAFTVSMLQKYFMIVNLAWKASGTAKGPVPGREPIQA